jgi:endonuclease/exonuclease/phosphatase family metal-dependent hydrolase
LKKFLKYSFFLFTSLPFLVLILCYIAPRINPESSRIFTILAYGYPYVVLVSLATLILVLFSGKWKLFTTYTVILLMGWNLHTQYYSLGSAKENSEDAFKIMSYNVRSFDLYENMNLGPLLVRDSILKYITTEAPDILCFQEFFYENRPRNFMTLSLIKEKFELHHHAGSFVTGTNKNTFFGCAIFSRYPIVDHGTVDMQSKSSNHCVYADIQKDSSIIRVYNFHIGSISFNEVDYAAFEEFEMDMNEVHQSKAKNLVRRFLKASRTRAQQLALILGHAEESPYPVILCGDLNDTPTSYAYRQLKTKYLDAFKQVGRGFGRTYVGKMPSNRIDYVFYDKAFEALNFTLQNEVLSDHKAIGVRMVLNQ